MTSQELHEILGNLDPDVPVVDNLGLDVDTLSIVINQDNEVIAYRLDSKRVF